MTSNGPPQVRIASSTVVVCVTVRGNRAASLELHMALNCLSMTVSVHYRGSRNMPC
jgi:hypothetical protein